MADFDLAIIGGGINGAGIARDAAGRGLSVLLVEQNDLASGTSSKSTKLIHGGLRYLEFYAFRLVREALIEREVLIRNAPHLTKPLRFVLPHHSGLRPAWILRLGLFMYDHLGGRHILPGTEAVDLTHHIVGEPLKREFRKGFIYSDGWVDDARLVVLNAVDAAERGAAIRTRTKLVRADREGDRWQLVLNVRGHREVGDCARAGERRGPVGAGCRPSICCGRRTSAHVRLVKGSHIVVRRLLRARPRLYFPEWRRPHRVCDPLRARLHADRHHGRGLQGRSQRADRERRRDHVSVPRGERLFPRSRDAGSGRACLRRRASAL